MPTQLHRLTGLGHSWPCGPGACVSRIKCGEVLLNVRIEGEGPPVLLVHGYPQNHRMWRRCVPMLARTHRVILPDLRGYGDSDKPPGDSSHLAYAKRTMAADLVALLDVLGIGACAAIGHDRGARVVHRLALDHPHRLTRALSLIHI